MPTFEPARPPWRVKYDGICSRCGIPLLTGAIAVYERPTRSIRCVECPTAAIDPDVAQDALEPEPPEPEFDSGTAGASARREFERRRLARQERIKGKIGDRLGGALLAVTRDPQSTRAWDVGAGGEETVGRMLDGIAGIRALHDRAVPRSNANIDHIAVAPAGVFVIDPKRYRGLIRVVDRGGLFRHDLRLTIGGRDRSHLAQGMIRQLDVVTKMLRDLGLDPPPPLTGVLCFVDGEWPLLFPPKSFAGVPLEGPRGVRRMLERDGPLDAAQIDRIAAVLGSALPPR